MAFKFNSSNLSRIDERSFLNSSSAERFGLLVTSEISIFTTVDNQAVLNCSLGLINLSGIVT